MGKFVVLDCVISLDSIKMGIRTESCVMAVKKTNEPDYSRAGGTT